MTQTETKQRELTITRVFDAPRELVFKAWTEPERVLHWLGPKGFTGTAFRLDGKTGGTWRATMRGPDGKEYANGGRVLEYSEPETLSYTFAWDDSPEEEMTVTDHAAGRRWQDRDDVPTGGVPVSRVARWAQRWLERIVRPARGVPADGLEQPRRRKRDGVDEDEGSTGGDRRPVADHRRASGGCTR